MQVYLKVKIMSLAAEARIIRHQERLWLNRARAAKKVEHQGEHRSLFWGLRNHRIEMVRREARSALLAYGYLRGRPYRVMEATCFEAPDRIKVAELVMRFGGKGLKDEIQAAIKAWMAVPIEGPNVVTIAADKAA